MLYSRRRNLFLFALRERILVDKLILPAYTSKLNFFENIELYVGKIL